MPGVTKADIEEFRDIIQDVKSDNDWYLTSIALSKVNVATQSLFLVQQIKGLANSVGGWAWGFDAGINLNIDTILEKANVYASSSVASNINANNINVKADNTALIQGSNINAKETINIDAKEANIVASRDKASDATNSEHANLNFNYSWFAGFSTSAAYDRSKSKSDQTVFTNSILNANNINVTTQEDMNVKGANILAKETIDLAIGKDLNIIAVQDRTRNDSDSFGANFSYSGGNGRNIKTNQSSNGPSSGSFGANMSNSNSRTQQTVDTSIIAQEINAEVKNETYLQGATIATLDKEGNDNNKLNLKTQTLNYEDLSNTAYQNNKSMGASIGVTTTIGKDGNNKEGITAPSFQYSNTLSLSKDKTLSTLGQGNIEVANKEESSDLERLNRDVTNTTKEIYAVNRQKGNIDVTIDPRLFTAEGRAQIKQDIEETANAISNAINTLDNVNRYVKDTVGGYKLTKELAQQIDQKGTKAALIDSLQGSGISEDDIQKILNNPSVQVFLKLPSSMPKEEPIYDQDGKLMETMVIKKIVPDDPSKPVKDVKYYVVSGAEAMNAIVDTVGENNAAMAILVLQFSVQGAVRTVTSVATEQVKDILFGGTKSLVSDYFAEDVLNVHDERWTPSQQNAIYSLSDASGSFTVDALISGGAFGIIKGAKNLGKANEVYNSSVNTNVGKTSADNIAPAKRESDTIVLGKTKNPNYGDVAAENGYRNFDIPAEQWNKMTSVEKWEANQKFLDRAISKGDNIVLSHNPNDPTVYTGYFKQEIEYLKSKGYSVSPDGKSMLPSSH